MSFLKNIHGSPEEGRLAARTPEFAKLEDHYADWRSSLSSIEREGLRSYMGTGAGPINRHLRGMSKHYDLTSTMDSVKRIMPHLDSAMERAPKSPYPIDLHRGIHPEPGTALHTQVSALRPGHRLHDHGFMSTSVEPKEAVGFGRTRLHIHAPTGSSLIPVPGSPEDEVLLHRGSALHVHKIETDEDGVQHIHTTLLPHTGVSGTPATPGGLGPHTSKE